MRKNPYKLFSTEWLDSEIWLAGCRLFADPFARYSSSRRARFPHELDFLRGLHNRGVVRAIRRYLNHALPGIHIAVSSLWLDKTAYVRPLVKGSLGPRRELADLAVVVRNLGTGQTNMWVLQAKKADAAAAPLGSGRSTRLEVELLEDCPHFQLEPPRAGASPLTFDLAPQFGGPAQKANYKHWSFLMFKKTPGPLAPSDPSPIQWRWDGRSKTPAVGSFAKGLVEMLTFNGALPAKGGLADAAYPGGWADLLQALTAHVCPSVTLGHARAPMRISSFTRNNDVLFLGAPPDHATFYSHRHHLALRASGLADRFDFITSGWDDVRGDGSDLRFSGSADAVVAYPKSSAFLAKEIDCEIREQIDRLVEADDDESDGRFGGGPGAPSQPGADEPAGPGARLTLFIDVM